MKKYFRYEEDLVKQFLNSKVLNKNKNIIIPEMPIRWGNIDIVSIKNNYIPFNKEQCQILSKPSNARLFLKIKSNRPITKNRLTAEAGLSEGTINSAIRELLSVGLVTREDNLYYRNVNFNFPKVIITGYEAKLIDYKKAFFQASINKEYVDYSYLVFPLDIANKIVETNIDLLIEHGIGIIGVTDKKCLMLLKAKRQKELKKYLKLISMVQSCLNCAS